MKKNELFAHLDQLGWKVIKDDAGDRVARFQLPDRVVSFVPDLSKVGDCQRVSVLPTLSTPDFSRVCREIMGNATSYTPLIRAWKSLQFEAAELRKSDVVEASEKTLTWGKEQKLASALVEHSNLPTSAPGARPIWHLAALVLTRDVQRLHNYRTSFLAGDRLGFVNYITIEHLERAIEMVDDPQAKSDL